MQFLLPILLLSTLTIIPLHSSLHESHFTKQSLRRSRTASGPPENYLEVAKPLIFDTMNSSCTLPILTHNFTNTYNLPPVSAPYSAPDSCTWSNAVLELQVSCKGEQYDRIAAVWLAGAELLRTSTAEPTENGVFWKVRKDVTKYSSLLAQDNLTLSVMLENIVNDVFTGVYEVNLTFHYYNVSPLIALPTVFESYDKPADLIVPISSGGENGFWFRIQNELDVHTGSVTIPTNTYRAVLEVFSSAHGDDEFWYSNPPDAYFKNMELSDSDMVKVKSNRGHGAYREILVKVDGDLVGTVVPFPVVFTGGINPLFWEPVVGIGAFDLPTYDLEITPFLNLVLDGKMHTFSFQVSNGISFWLVDANLHLWLDRGSAGVQAGMKSNKPEFSLEREYKFRGLDGKFEIETEREVKISGWMNTSAGKLTTSYKREVEFENTIEFRENGTRKSVEQKVKEKTVIEIKSGRVVIFKLKTKREYPLKLETQTIPGENGTYYMTTTLENSIQDEKTTGTGKFSTILKNRQDSRGGMLVKDHEVLDGDANTQQRYAFRDQVDCYARDVAAANGTLVNDVSNSLCEAHAAWFRSLFLLKPLILLNSQKPCKEVQVKDIREDNLAKPFLSLVGLEESENAVDFCLGLSAGKWSPFYKSKSIPDNKKRQCFDCCGKTFDDLILSNHQSILLEVYTPWCVDCDKIAKQVEKLAKHFKGMKNLVFARIDASANEHPKLQVEEYPTLLFYTAKDKQNPIKFSTKSSSKELAALISKSLKEQDEVAKDEI